MGQASAIALGDALFRALGDGAYYLSYPEVGIEFSVDRTRRERHELVGELSVSCGLVGARTVDGILSVGTFNLSSPAAAQQRAKLLAERARTTGLDWSSMLEEVRQRVLTADRKGAPSINLRNVDLHASTETEFNLYGITVPLEHLSIWFGDGGTGKSLLSLQLLVEMARAGQTVGLFDSELSEVTQRRRLGQLTGDDMPDVRYVRLDRPLVYEVDRLRRIIRQDRIDFAVLDSVAYGTAGAPESAEAAMDYCRAVRQLGIGTLAIAHITKGENGDQRPFGSTFWHNSARSTWFLKLASTSPDGQVLQLAAFHRKSNLGRLRQPIGLTARFEDHRVFFDAVDPSTIDEVATSLPLHVRLRGALRSGPRTIVELADELGAKPDTVKKTLNRGGHVFTRIPNTADGVHRWALLERQSS